LCFSQNPTIFYYYTPLNPLLIEGKHNNLPSKKRGRGEDVNRTTKMFEIPKPFIRTQIFADTYYRGFKNLNPYI